MAGEQRWSELFSGPLGPALGQRISVLFATSGGCRPEQQEQILAALDPNLDPEQVLTAWAERRLAYFQQLLVDPDIAQLAILDPRDMEFLQQRCAESRELLSAEDGNRQQFADQLQTDISSYQLEIDELYEDENEQTDAEAWPFGGAQMLTEGLLLTVRSEPEELAAGDDLRYFSFALEYLAMTPGSPRGQLFGVKKEAWQQAEGQWLLAAMAAKK